VDDLLIMGHPKDPNVALLKRDLMELYKMKDLGEARVFIGMDISWSRDRSEVTLTNEALTRRFLKRYDLVIAPSNELIPMPSDKVLVKEGVPYSDARGYRELVGMLNYLVCIIRVDLAFVVGQLARFIQSPTTDYWAAAIDVLRYLAATADLGLCYQRSGCAADLSVRGAVDADHCKAYGDLTRRAVLSCMFMLAGAAVDWQVSRSSTTPGSTVEGEYMAAYNGCRGALWLSKLTWDFELEARGHGTILIDSDSMASLAMIKNPAITQRTKHIDVVYHFVRDRVDRGEVSYRYVSTHDNYADLGTKPLARAVFWKHVEALGMTRMIRT
jgi:hypothetical protein